MLRFHQFVQQDSETTHKDLGKLKKQNKQLAAQIQVIKEGLTQLSDVVVSEFESVRQEQTSHKEKINLKIEKFETKTELKCDDLVGRIQKSANDRESLKAEIERTKIMVNSLGQDSRLGKQMYDEQFQDLLDKVRQLSNCPAI